MAGKEANSERPKASLWSRAITTALIAVAVVVGVRVLGPQTVGEHARRSFLRTLRTHYPDLQVSIRRGKFDPGVGLVFEDLVISDPAASRGHFHSREMLRVGRMVVVGDLEPEKLLERQTPLTARRIVIDGLEADAWMEQNGTVSLSRLWPPPTLGPTCPRIELHGANLRWLDRKGRERPVQLELARAVLLTEPSGKGGTRQTVRLTGATDFAKSLQVEIVAEAGQRRGRLSAKQVHLTEELLARLPDQWCPKLDGIRELDCLGSIEGTFAENADGTRDYRLGGRVHAGRLEHVRAPMPITEIRGAVTVTPRGVEVEPSQATLGDALCRFSGSCQGTDWRSNSRLHLQAYGLMLNDRIASALPDEMRVQWNRLQPFGRIDVDAGLVYQRGQFGVEGSVVCKGVDVRYQKFPYPVKQLVGRIQIEDGFASSSSVNGRIGASMLRCAFRVPLTPGTSAERFFVFDSDGAIPIDRTLLESLSPRTEPDSKLESFVRSLSPGGSVWLKSAQIRTDKDGHLHRDIVLAISNGRLRYEKFAYPLYNVNGEIKVEDNHVHIVGFKAANANAGTVRCGGFYRMPRSREAARSFQLSDDRFNDPAQSYLQLTFEGSNLAMDESLRSSLPLTAQSVWDSVSPSGVLDDLKVNVTQQGNGNPLRLDVTASQNETSQVNSRSLSLRPPAIPYRLDITGGSVHYDGKRVSIRSVRGRHDASQVAADGRCVKTPEGRWLLSLNVHGGSRLVPDAELIEALPNEMKEAMRRLQLRGPVSIRGSTNVLLSDARHSQPVIEWDVLLQLEGNRIGDVGPVHSLRGELSIQGRRDAQMLAAQGEARIDSMHVNDLQIMGIRGPFSIEDDRLRLGATSHANAQPVGLDPVKAAGTPAAPIRGRIFDGVLDLNGNVTLSSGDFDVAMSLTNARVPTLLAELGHAHRDLTGLFGGQTRLVGRLGAFELLSGTGAAQLSGANLYQLPLLVQLLNQLRITPTEDVAFTDGEVEFSLDDDEIHFSQLQLWGDLVALRGFGSLNRRKELDLTFNTLVSPQNLFAKAIRPLRDSRYTFWTINVRGPLEAPSIERRALEGVGETIEKLFPNFSSEPKRDRSIIDPVRPEQSKESPRTASRGWFNGRF